MKKYQAGGVTEQIPQEAQNVLMDREENRQREAFERSREEENRAPRKRVTDIIERMFGSKKPKTEKKKPSGMASGGYVRKADGCAQRGKTKGRMV